MVFPRSCLHQILHHLNHLLHGRHLARAGTTFFRGGRIYKTRATSPTMPNNSGLVRQSEHQAAHSVGPCTIAGPEPPVVKFHPPSPNYSVSTIPPIQSPLEWIHELLDSLPSQASFNLTRHLLATAFSVPSSTALQGAVLNNVILFICSITAQPRKANGGKTLRLSYLKADGIRGRKLQLDHFLLRARSRNMPPKQDALTV
jgi:hypothetical protein